MTIHRAENTDNRFRLENIVRALSEISKYQEVVFPCHPRTEKQLKQNELWNMLVDIIKITRPVGYLDMLVLEKNAAKILTDSGGVQKSSRSLKVKLIW